MYIYIYFKYIIQIVISFDKVFDQKSWFGKSVAMNIGKENYMTNLFTRFLNQADDRAACFFGST